MESLFNIGDEVICIDAKWHDRFPRPLIEGKKYKVKYIDGCSCGIVGISFGQVNPYGAIRCKCGIVMYTNFWFYTQNRFVKPETNYQLEEEIFEAMKGQKILN